MDLLFVLAGLVLLVVAGDLLVRGAVALSLRLGISALVVSLTVVAFGTSAPELLIGVTSAIEGAPGIALGNVVGSNIANVLLVLGLPALISSISVEGRMTRTSFIKMLGVTALFIALCFAGPLIWWHGAVLLAAFVVVMALTLRQARTSRRAAQAAASLSPPGEGAMTGRRATVFVILGIIGLPLGAHFLIEGARSIALDLGVTQEVIGLTLVAVGTSLPELATTVIAAWRRQADVALGNAIGSNIFNIVLIMGVTSFFGPLDLAPAFLVKDLWVMAAAALLLAPFVLNGIRLGRRAGVLFLAAYAAYIVTLF